MKKGECNNKKLATLNKSRESSNETAAFLVDFNARSSAELSKIVKIKQEKIQKLGSQDRGSSQMAKRQMEKIQESIKKTSQLGGSSQMAKRQKEQIQESTKMASQVRGTSQVAQRQKENSQESSKMTSKLGGSTQSSKRQLLPTNVTQTQLTQMEKRQQPESNKNIAQVGGSSQQAANEKKRQSVATSKNQESNQSEHCPKIRTMNAVCPAMSLDDFLQQNGVHDEDIQLLHDEDDFIDHHVQNEDVEEMNDNAEGVETKKKTRGKTQCKSIHARLEEEREEIIFEKRAAIGPTNKSVSNLSLFLGTIARNSKFCPLNYTNFKAIPEGYIEDMLEYVRSKFIIPKEGEDWVLSGIREAWKRHKCKIKKKHFEPYDNIEEMLKNRPEDVPISVFKKLIAFWSLPTIKKIGKMNAENRKRQRWNHRMGPVNFARVRKRLRLANESDQDVTQVDLFIATRTGAKGKELDLETQSAIDNVQDRVENCGESVDDAFQAVFGKERPGRVRGYGRGVTKTSLKMDAEIDAVKRKHSEEILSLKAEMEKKMDNQMDDMKKQVAGLESIVKVLLERASPDVRLEDLQAALMRSSAADANSAPNANKIGIPHSSTSTHSPNQG